MIQLRQPGSSHPLQNRVLGEGQPKQQAGFTLKSWDRSQVLQWGRSILPLVLPLSSLSHGQIHLKVKMLPFIYTGAKARTRIDEDVGMSISETTGTRTRTIRVAGMRMSESTRMRMWR